MADIIIPKAAENPVALTPSYSRKSDWFNWGKLPELKVYVEDEEDKPFWAKLFACVSDKRRVDISVIKRESTDAIIRSKKGNDEIHGKDILMKVPNLSDRKVVAVDADYDLLVDYHTYSERVRKDKYVIHTEYYSIENHLLEASVITNLLIWRGVNAIAIDWSKILNSLAFSVADAVKLCIASTERRENAYKEDPTSQTLPNTLKVSEISSGINAIQFTPDNYQNLLDGWKASFENGTFTALQTQCEEELKTYNGWSSQDVLHNIQGHTLYNFMEKAILYYFQAAYTQLENTEIGLVTDKTKIPDVIRSLKQRLGITNGNKIFIRNSIYSASALDVNDDAISKIQNQIRAILNYSA